MKYYTLNGISYVPFICPIRGIALRKAARKRVASPGQMSLFGSNGPKRGDTKVVNGVTYQLNQHSRWERTDKDKNKNRVAEIAPEKEKDFLTDIANIQHGEYDRSRNKDEATFMDATQSIPSGYKKLIQNAQTRFAKELQALEESIKYDDEQINYHKQQIEKIKHAKEELDDIISNQSFVEFVGDEQFYSPKYLELTALVDSSDLQYHIKKIEDFKSDLSYSKSAGAATTIINKLTEKSDELKSRLNVSNIEFSDNLPVDKNFYQHNLFLLFQISNNQVSTLHYVLLLQFGDKIISRAGAYKDWNGDGVGAINVGVKSESHNHLEGLWHEFGHHLEFSNPVYRDAAIEWRRSRASGGKLIQLSENDPNEVALPGRYVDKYVGKIYETGDTEVISVGLQHFYDLSKMVEFYRQDKEHFLLILGMLAE